MGSAEYISWSIVAPRVALVVSSCGGIVDTVTFSVPPPTVILGFRVCVSNALIWTFTWVSFSKPWAVTVMVYTPASSVAIVKSPADVLVVVVDTPLVELVAVIVAPGIDAPVGSCTTPLTAPLPASCALALPLTIKKITTHSALSIAVVHIETIPSLRVMDLLKVFQLLLNADLRLWIPQPDYWISVDTFCFSAHTCQVSMSCGHTAKHLRNEVFSFSQPIL